MWAARACMWWKRPWVTTPGTPTTTWAMTAWWLPTPREGSCDEPGPRPPRVAGGPRPARTAGSSSRPGRYATGARRRAGQRLGPGRRAIAARPGAGLVRLSRAGPAVVVDRVCAGGVPDVDGGHRGRPGARVGAADAGRGAGGGHRHEARRPAGRRRPAGDHHLADGDRGPVRPHHA